jgi:Leucine rich repeat N-terminal domain
MREAMNYHSHASAMLLKVLLLVLVVQWWETVNGAEWRCREEERKALLQINASLHFPIFSAEGDWRGMECCRWERVTCDPTTGHVTELNLDKYWDARGRSYYPQDSKLLNASIFLPLRQLKSLILSGHGIPGFMAGAGTISL